MSHKALFALLSDSMEKALKKEIQDSNQRFKDEYGIYPDTPAPMSYDTAYLIFEAIEKEEYSAKRIKNAFYGIKDFTGVAGLTCFDENGDVINQ